jgi:hypothetical protein
LKAAFLGLALYSGMTLAEGSDVEKCDGPENGALQTAQCLDAIAQQKAKDPRVPPTHHECTSRLPIPSKVSAMPQNT